MEPGAAEPDGAPPPALPDEVRERVVVLAADTLSSLPPDAVPPALRAVARFTPAKRARLAAGGLAAALETEPAFRQAVAETATGQDTELARAVADGVPLPAAPPEREAALAYLLRPPGWQGRLAAAAEQLAARATAAAGAATVDAVARLTEQLAAARAAAGQEADRLRADVDAARAETVAARRETAALRRKVRELGDRAATAERRLAGTPAATTDPPEPGADPPEPAAPPDSGAGSTPGAAAEVRRLRARVAELETALAAARSAARDDRQAGTVRLRVLVDALVRASTGIQRELALPPVDERPADAVAAELAVPVDPALPAHRGRAPDDPALLDELLSAPLVHLVVDGYNVTKAGYGDQTLEVQRGRLVRALASLCARTNAEVTVVFDGQDRTAPLAPPSPRGVRVLFSRTGQTADDVIRALVAAEPPGRAVVVVTSDREIVDDVRAAGARAVPSAGLLRLLER